MGAAVVGVAAGGGGVINVLVFLMYFSPFWFLFTCLWLMNRDDRRRREAERGRWTSEERSEP